MDYSNLNDVMALAQSEDDRKKVSLFLKHGIVPDPYHDDNEFDSVFQLIEIRCKEIIGEFSSTP